ncbi:MAG: hypothetical protein P4L27_08260 [Ignavibacteriaceae bacterium]|nr:hypothetical protein [Ignavibacteriaceae bacterium]
MTDDEINKMVELYFDGELDKNSEPVLFAFLSDNIEAREYFKKLNFLRTIVAESIESFPIELEENILNSTKVDNRKTYKYTNFRSRMSNFVSIAVAAILLIVCSLLFLEVKDYKSKIASITEQLKEQKETINVILNYSLPAIVINPEVEHEVIVRANARRKI